MPNIVQLLVVILVGVWAAREKQEGEQWCMVRVAAPSRSSWGRVGRGCWRVPVTSLLRLARHHSLELRKGKPPPHSAPPHLLITVCHSTQRWLWAKLPEQVDLGQPLEDDNSGSFACFIERLQEGFLALIGDLRWSPEQKNGYPAREYMENYCGKELPVAEKPVGGKRMFRETLRLEQELLRLP